MKVLDMPLGEVLYWEKRVADLKKSGFTKQAWCDLGHELMQKYGVTEQVAVRFLHGDYDLAMLIEKEQEAAHD